MNQPTHPLGEIVRRSDGTTSLRFERELAGSAERVWRALTESDQLRHWMPCDIVGPREAGADVTAPFWDDVVRRFGIEDTVLSGRIVTWDPPSTFAWEWDDELLTFSLEPNPTGTHLTLRVDSGDKSPEVHQAAAGYHMCLDQLCTLVDTDNPPRFIDADPSRYEVAYAGFPRSANYDPAWVVENMMGPNPLWLTESLSGCMDLDSTMRVLDLGCGKALSSIFLAKEFGVQVWAADLWIDASDNLDRIRAAGVEDRVFPIRAEAHELPFADSFFDAVVCIDAYHYFGTDDLYLEQHLARLIGPGGQLGIVVPGLVEELTSNAVPAHLQQHWEPAFFSFHSPAWWQRHWERSGLVTVELADLMPDGWKHWMASDLSWSEHLGKPSDEADMLAGDQGETLGLTRVVARRNDRPTARLTELQ